MNLADFGIDESIVRLANDFVEQEAKIDTVATSEMIKFATMLVGELPEARLEFILESYAATVLYKYLTSKVEDETVDKLFGAKIKKDGEDNAN